MSETKHTPGPWQPGPSEYDHYVWAADGQMMICQMRGWGYLTGVGTLNLSNEEAAAIQDANKALICAAPDLLEACKNAVAYMEKTSSDPDRYHAEMMILLRAAIAKSEGTNEP